MAKGKLIFRIVASLFSGRETVLEPVQDKQTVLQDEQTVLQDKQTVLQDKQTVLQDKQTVLQDKQPVLQDKQPVLQDTLTNSKQVGNVRFLYAHVSTQVTSILQSGL